MEHIVLHKLVLIVILGILCHWFAWRLKFPSIALFSVAGLAIGPIFQFVDPSQDFGVLLESIVKLALAVILFEGGLNLKFHELQHTGRAIKQLICLGLPLSWFLGFLVCYWVADLSFSLSLLLSAILVVTGPTVILPLIRQTKLKARTSSLLKWEGIINDPIGILLAVLVFQFTVASEYTSLDGTTIFYLLGTVASSILIGIGGGHLLKFIFEKGHAPEFLKLPLVFATVLSLYALSNLFQEEIGLLTVTVMGITMGNIGMLIIHDLRKFKENITVIMVPVVFILLTADLALENLMSLNWRVFGFLFCFLFLVRPVSVWVSTQGAGLSWQERAFIGWIAPRGIVATSIAGLLGLKLEVLQFQDAELLLPLVFAVVLSTVILHGFSIGWLARRLKLSGKSSNGVLIVGAHKWSVDLALTLEKAGLPVLLVSDSWNNLKKARLLGVPIHYGEVLSENVHQSLELSDMGYLLANTGNHAYNSLVCSVYIQHFGRNRVFQIATTEKKQEEKQLSSSFRGKVLFGGSLIYKDLIVQYIDGWRFQRTRLTEEFDMEKLKNNNEGKVKPFIRLQSNGELDLDFYENQTRTKPGDTIISFSYNEKLN
jgi:NhaP-type Na+/H+ or K+/H+ antiporter